MVFRRIKLKCRAYATNAATDRGVILDAGGEYEVRSVFPNIPLHTGQYDFDLVDEKGRFYIGGMQRFHFEVLEGVDEEMSIWDGDPFVPL